MSGPHPPSTPQLLALVSLRWRMIRSRQVRLLLLVIGVLPPALIIIGLLALQQAPEEQVLNVGIAAPTIYVGFVVLAVLAPLVSGGGYELYPPGQLVAYPIRPETVFRGTLVLAPVNLAWIINVIALFVATGFAAGPLTWAGTSRALVVVGSFVALATVVGHAVGWLIVGIRQTRRGRVTTNLAGLGLLFAIAAIFWTDNVISILENSPTRTVFFGALDGYTGRVAAWFTLVVTLLVAAALATIIGGWITGWALRRPGDHADRAGSKVLSRRPNRTSTWVALLLADHASLWRSTPLRRGVLVLFIVPAIVSAVAGMSWQSLILVPGLIAAGAGLLFGINAFALDSTGAIWLSTLPGWAAPAFAARSLIFFEVAAGAVLSALIGGSLRAPPPNSSAEVTAAISSALACTLIVVAIGMRSSVRHPQRADLQEPRDTPATPGVMAAQSVRFAAVTTFTSLYFSFLALAGDWWLPLLGAVPIIIATSIHWRRTRDAWLHPHVQAHVVVTVAAG